mgnify:CR=1 FL=1
MVINSLAMVGLFTDEEGNTYTSDSITDSSGNKTSYEGG